MHCVVWAKELYKLLFGKADESYAVLAVLPSTWRCADPDVTRAQLPIRSRGEQVDVHDSGGCAACVATAVLLPPLPLVCPQVNNRPTSFDSSSTDAYARAVFTGLFRDEIASKLSMKDFKVRTRVHCARLVGGAQSLLCVADCKAQAGATRSGCHRRK